jgi:hypothetical protein
MSFGNSCKSNRVLINCALQQTTLRQLLTGVIILLVMPYVAFGQYPLVPFPTNYQGPSGERGQIKLDGIVWKVSLFHGEVADEADWHVYIDFTKTPNVYQELANHLKANGYNFIKAGDMIQIYSELMVCDRHKSTWNDEYFYSADFTLPFLLSQPNMPKSPYDYITASDFWRGVGWTGEHPAWDLGLIAQTYQSSNRDFSEHSKLIGTHAYLQGAFVEDAEHRICPSGNNNCPLSKAVKTRIEIHPLDSITFAMKEGDTVISSKRGHGDWPDSYVKWRVAFFANSKFHRINSESYLKKERTTTWYLDLPDDAYNSWGEIHTTVNVEEQRQSLWDGYNRVWYSGRGVKSLNWSLAVDPKDKRKKLKVSATMNVPDKWGGIVVLDYVIRVTQHSNPNLGIRLGNSSYADAQFHLGVVARQNVPRSTTAVYYVRGQNQGPVPIQFRYRATVGDANWNVRYFNAAGDNITSQITGSSGWLSPLIPSGGSTEEIRVEVTPSANLPNGREKLVRVWASSSVEPGRQDIVEAITKVGQPDKLVQ